MSNIKLVVTDIDGTLVPIHAKQVTLAVQEAVQAVHAAGATVAAATARPYDMAHDMFVQLGLSGPSIFDGGASIYDVVTGELLWQNWLDVKRLQKVAELTFQHSKIVDFFPGLRPEEASNVTPADIVEDAPYAWCLISTAELPRITKELEAMGGLNLHILGGYKNVSGYIDVQITDKKSDKFHGVQALRKIVHATKEQTLAIGDGTNDVPLFKAAGVKVAMGNAAPELKELADYKVAPVENDGWAEAMRQFVLS